MIVLEGFTYIPSFLTPSEHQTLLGLRELAFAHDSFRGQQLKRSYAQFGYSYGSTGRWLEPALPFPTFLKDLVSKASPLCPFGTRFYQCIIAHYPAGAGIGWHTDAPQFGDCIMALSLAGPARLQFRPNRTTHVSHELIAEPGSIY
jgi:alkylated DNA repair dioxygenase AlkB